MGDAGVATGVAEPYTGEPEMWISCSDDLGHTWESSLVDFSLLSPEGSADPYASRPYSPAENLIELPDGTLLFGANVFYPEQMARLEGKDGLAVFCEHDRL